MSAPVQLDFSKAIPVNQPAQPQGDGSDVTLDFSKAQPITTAAPQSSPPAASPAGPMAEGGEDIVKGIGHGLAQSGAGALNIVEKLANPSGDPNNERPWFRDTKNFLEQHSQNTGTDIVSRGLQGAGNAIEGLGEWLLGDEALKGATLSERLLNAGKAAKVIESSPRLTAVVKAGIQALRGAAIGGAEAGVKSGGSPGATAGGAVAGGIGNVVIPGAINSAKELPALFDTLRNVIRPGIIQDAFQGDIRSIINEAAQEHGVAPSSAPSIRDVANDVSNALQSRAKSAYQALDDATGGRVQRFSDAIRAVQKKLVNLNGIATPDDEGKWVEHLNDLTDAHDKAMQEAEAAGVPRTLLDQANADYRKAMAMADLNRAIRASSEGLRPELAEGASKPIPEKVNTGKLFNRVNKLYDSGRLQDAIGAGRSGDLLRATNEAHAVSQTVQNLRSAAGSTARHLGGYSTAGILYEVLRHMWGE